MNNIAHKPVGINLSQVRKLLINEYKILGGWREVGAQYGISPAMAWRIAKRKYEPKDPKIRVRLGLPTRVEVSACPSCGEVHLKKHCPNSPKKVSRHRDLLAMDVRELRMALEERKELGGSRPAPTINSPKEEI